MNMIISVTISKTTLWLNKLDGICIGVTLDIQKKSYDNMHFTGRTLERTVKTIKLVGYTEYNVVAW